MRIQGLSSNIWLWLVMSFLPLLMAQSVRAEVKQSETPYTSRITPLNPPLSSGETGKSSSLPFTRGGLGWGKTVAQGEKQGGVVQVTAVKANPTAKGVEVILQTTKGEQLQITNRSTGNNPSC